MTIELDRHISNSVKDYKSICSLLKEFIKILEKNIENDLHVLRNIRFIHFLVEVCKSVHICPKNDLEIMVEILNSSTRLLMQLCSIKQNRIYMLMTNKVIPLVDLLHWAWSNSSKYVYCFNFIPDIFHLVNLLLRQK